VLALARLFGDGGLAAVGSDRVAAWAAGAGVADLCQQGGNRANGKRGSWPADARFISALAVAVIG
jgi:hypothetical protein